MFVHYGDSLTFDVNFRRTSTCYISCFADYFAMSENSYGKRTGPAGELKIMQIAYDKSRSDVMHNG